MKISVIIPTKNRAADLSQTLASVLAQTRMPDELIVVDQSFEKPVDTSGASEAVRIAHIWNPQINGLPMARNVGFAASTGDIICFLDDDVSLDCAYFRAMERAFQDYEDVAGLTGRLTEAGRDPFWRGLKATVFRHRFLRDRRHRLASLKEQIQVTLLPGCSFAVRRAVLERFQFDSDLKGYALGEDVDFFLRAEQVFRFMAVPELKSHHRRSLKERATPEQMRAAIRLSTAYLWKRHRQNLLDDGAYLWFLIGHELEFLVKTFIARLRSDSRFAAAIPVMDLSAAKTPVQTD